ncbi:MAG: hypothetical protein OXC91_04890 [Rhodobacteraceae bacterium]|nr:hypothetical protein [Paracoccaceae bacterium]
MPAVSHLHPLLATHRIAVKAGTDDSDPVHLCFGCDEFGIALPGEDTILVNGPGDVLRHLVVTDDPPDLCTDLFRIPIIMMFGATLYALGGKSNGFKQVLALAGVLPGKRGIAVDSVSCDQWVFPCHLLSRIGITSSARSFSSKSDIAAVLSSMRARIAGP